MARNYRKVIAWQLAHELTLAVYQSTKAFPGDERYGITSQIRRAAFSAPSNIAEGSGRDTNKEYLRFLVIGLGSLKETEYLVLLALDLNYLEKHEYERLTDLVNSAMKTLQGLVKAVRKDVGVLGRIQAHILATTVIALGKLYSPFV